MSCKPPAFAFAGGFGGLKEIGGCGVGGVRGETGSVAGMSFHSSPFFHCLFDCVLSVFSSFELNEFTEGVHPKWCLTPHVRDQFRDRFNVGDGGGAGVEKHFGSANPGVGELGVGPRCLE